jgi:hypothetical protein
MFVVDPAMHVLSKKIENCIVLESWVARAPCFISPARQAETSQILWCLEIGYPWFTNAPQARPQATRMSRYDSVDTGCAVLT